MKKARRIIMKKFLSLMLVIFVLFNLCACNSTNSSEKVGFITKTELAQYSEYIELTTENWSEYFEIVIHESTQTDVFGEETGTSISKNIVLKDGCYISKDNAIRLTYDTDDWYDDKLYKSTRDIVFAEDMAFVEGYKSLLRGMLLPSNMVGVDVTCEKIKGTILKLSIPEERWVVDEDGAKYIEVSGYDRPVYYNCSWTITYDSFVGE